MRPRWAGRRRSTQRRGRFRESLFAETAERSDAWRAFYAEHGLPLLPDISHALRIGPNPWRWLAYENGREERKLQERSGLSKAAFTHLRQIAQQQDVLFTLPFWCPPGEHAPGEHLLYWSDSGALHWQLGLTERILTNWDLTEPDGPTQRARRALKMPRETSWEGFAISSLMRAAGMRASGTVWRGPNGEIDLIMNWSTRPNVWAVEVTLGRKKRLSPGFDLGCNLTQADRGILVYNDRIGIPRVVLPKNFSRLVEVMSLGDALREVRAGP